MTKVISEFGRLLRYYRRECTDPDRGGTLTQERLAELLSNRIGREYGRSAVSGWEQGKSRLDHDDRELLVHLIGVLHDCKGMVTLNDANHFLKSGNYRILNDEEVTKVSPDWQPHNTSPEGSDGQSVSHILTNIRGTVPATITPKQTEPPFMTPALPPQGVVGRNEFLARIIQKLALNSAETDIPPLALRGMGGIGKTTLAKSVGRVENIQTLFPDGVLWVEIGPTPTIRLELDKWGSALGVDLLPERDEEACRDRLQSILYHRQVLLLVDDIWDAKHGNYFMVAGPSCRTLLTTREPHIAYDLVTREQTLRVDLLSPESSLELLCRLAPEAVTADEKNAKQLCERLEYLPLALTLAGRLLASETDVPSRMQRILGELSERGEGKALQLTQTEGRKGISEDEPVSIEAILGLSVERLDKNDKERFAMAAVFGGEPLTWDINAAAAVWDCSVEQAEDTTALFINRGLVERRQPDGRYWMHALLADYAADLMEEMGL